MYNKLYHVLDKVLIKYTLIKYFLIKYLGNRYESSVNKKSKVPKNFKKPYLTINYMHV